MVVRTAYFSEIKCNQGTSAKAKYSGRGKKGKITCDLLTLLPLITGAPDGYIFHEWCEHLRKHIYIHACSFLAKVRSLYFLE